MRIWYAVIALLGIALIFYSVQMVHQPTFNMSKWYSFKEGENLSLKEKKKMFVFIASPTCPKCADFKKFFSNPQVMDYISKHFIPVYVDVSRERPINVYVVPTFCVGYPGNLTCFLASSGSQLMRILSKMSQ